MSDKHAESASQVTIWDLEIDSITGLTNAEFLNAISVDDSPDRNTGSGGTSPGSALSSAPSGLLIPTIGAEEGWDDISNLTRGEIAY
ncbi:hypothetical protein B9Z19DRAFT_1124970 [Tuber borchii]|uniref:Uncharacterized protein n=1 Tax=Tuber borchii TaxID=42251 RepID=A0A2T6ZVP4_TUBBO|nr:hypothetical protein B9Z19DRAFT_1124970 [Tuber borchii]